MPKLLWGVLALLLAASFDLVGAEESGDGAIPRQLEQFVPVKLETDLSGLSANQQRMLQLLLEAAAIMDEIFWRQAYGDRDELFNGFPDAATRKLLGIHYGPWDRYNGNVPLFLNGEKKPFGANFYPGDMTREELEKAAKADPSLTQPYSMVRRDAEGKLQSIPYHDYFAKEHAQAAEKLRQAAKLAEDDGFKRYLNLRAAALLNGDYQASDFAWMAMKSNTLDLVIGPIEIYEDQFGYKAAHEAFVLMKDKLWSRKLERYAEFLPLWQSELPVEDIYKQDTPGSDSDLGAYDVLLYSGDAAATRAIAVNLPNDPEVQLKSGSRRLQLKNAMQAKFDKILKPMSAVLIHPDQQKHVTMDAFFANTMYHEIAHGLGVKRVIGSGNTVDSALKENSWMLEEGKADAMGMFIASKLRRSEGWSREKWLDSMVTSFASIFRSIRFGATSSHARANLIRFNFLKEQNAFTRSPDGLYLIDPEKMEDSLSSLIATILRLQGDGDYQGVIDLEKKYGVVGPRLKEDMARLNSAGIPLDVVFK